MIMLYNIYILTWWFFHSLRMVVLLMLNGRSGVSGKFLPMASSKCGDFTMSMLQPEDSLMIRLIFTGKKRDSFSPEWHSWHHFVWTCQVEDVEGQQFAGTEQISQQLYRVFPFNGPGSDNNGGSLPWGIPVVSCCFWSGVMSKKE